MKADIVKNILASIILLFIMIAIYRMLPESFTNKQEKAQKNYDWFIKHPHPSYTAYKYEFDDQANIVDYENIARLMLNNQLTVDTIVEVI